MRAYVPDYDLVEAKSLPDALDLLSSGANWCPIAGGTDLMVLFAAGKLPQRRLVSIRNIPELSQIDVTKDSITIGAAVTYSRIRQSRYLQRAFPLLCQSASWTGGIANQNRGTLGGNIANASPAADSPPALLVYGATIELVSNRGVHSVPYRDFHTGYKQMRMEPDELLYRIQLRPIDNAWRQYGRKVGTRKAMAISKVCLAGVADVDGALLRDVRLALGSVAPMPLRCIQTENVLRGEKLTDALIVRAREALRDEIHPIDDIRSTAAYRVSVSQNLLQEFLEQLR